jgi:hypothetical protein
MNGMRSLMHAPNGLQEIRDIFAPPQ